MAYGVYFADLDIEVNLTLPDLGHPELPDLWDLIYPSRKLSPTSLQCLQCLVEQGPECPEYMYLRVRDGRRHAVHHNRNIRDHPTSSESDAHKALKERMARAAERGGFTADIESRSDSGKRVTDVLIRGANGILLGCEPQLAYASAASIRRRTATAAADGVTALWTTNDRYAQLIDRAPWARIDRMQWHGYATASELPVRGGVRALVMEECARLGVVCPDRRAGRRCSGWHGTWEPRQVPLDDLIIRAAAGELVAYEHRVGQRTHWSWVPTADLANIGQSRPAPSRSRQEASKRGQDPRPLSHECRYGIKDWVPTTSSPRDAGESIGAVGVIAPPSAGCCGEGGEWCHAAAGALVPGCQLCPKSPTYWRRRGST